jgi:TatD DNase family protein
MLTDTHCHFVSEKLRGNLDDYMKAAQAANVTRIINIAYTWETTLLGIEITKEHDNLWTTCGIQPHDAASYSPELAEKMRLLIQTEQRILAIGEIGLDACYTLSPMPQQQQCFEHFLDIACQVDRPVVIHVRQTHHQVVEQLRPRAKKGIRGVIHCFTGTLDEAKEFLDLGFFISFSGIVTFKNATQLLDVAKYVPNERILIETDAPYLAPVPHRGQINQPAFLRSTAEFIAAARKSSLEEFAALTSRNATQLFGLPV